MSATKPRHGSGNYFFLSTGPVPDTALLMLGRAAPVHVAPDQSEATLIGLAPGAIGLVVRADARITTRVIDAATSLRVIGRTGVGYDNVDVAAATARGIPVVITPGANARGVAEATLASMLALSKNLAALDRCTRDGRWSERNTTPIGDLRGQALGLIGFGRIGREVAKLAQAFDMRVLVFDPILSSDAAATFGITRCNLDVLFGEADVISLHLPLTDETQGMVNRSTLSRMKRGVMLVNFSRGGLFESLDVIDEALQSGQVGSAAIDTFPTEPPDVTHPIFKRPNVLFSPHSAGISRDAFEQISVMMCDAMLAVLSVGTPDNVANPMVYDALRGTV